MTLLLTALLTLQLAQLTTSQPSISFPINSQLPPVARIDQLFSYSFSPHTFRSDSNITYSLGQHPDWVSVESDERRLFGTPKDENVPPGDVVGQTVEVIATDDSGSVTLMTTLVVSRNDAPEVEVPLSEQLKKFGNFSAPSSLLSYPSTDFTYAFAPDTFGEQADNVNYYAVSDDSSPLPAWVRFDAPTLTFSGTTPRFESLVQPPQTFNFELVASDVVGFSASSIFFSIVVGSHKLTTEKPIVTFNTSRGDHLSYKGLADGIKLDGQPVKPGNLDVATTGLPEWLSFDTDTWEIEGTPGHGDRSTNFTISFHDDFADTLSVLGVVNVATSLFESTLPDMEVMPGDKFELDMASYFRDPDDIKVTTDTKPNADWLKLDGLRMTGEIPKSASGHLKISIAATSKSSGLKETETLGVKFVSPKQKTASSTFTTATATSTSSEPTETESHSADAESAESGPGNLTTSQILLATIIPIIVIALIIMLLVCFMRRRHNKRTYLSSKYREKISKPMLGTLRVNGSDPSIRQVDREKGGVVQKETQMQKPAKGGYTATEVPSRGSSGSRTDVESLRQVPTSDLPPGYMGGGLRTSDSLGTTEHSDNGRQSWYTVEATEAAHPSERARSHRSDTTFPESTHMLLTTPSVAFRGGLDLAIPPLDDLSSLRPSSEVAYNSSDESKAPRNVEVYSTTTSSSEALPRSRPGSRRGPNGPSTSRRYTGAAAAAARDDAPSPLREQDESASHVPELRPPAQARLSSQQRLNKQRPGTSAGPGAGTGSQVWQALRSGSVRSQESPSLRTEPSFGSSENWRVIGGPAKSYRDLVEESPFHPGPAGGVGGSDSGGVGGDGSGQVGGIDNGQVREVREHDSGNGSGGLMSEAGSHQPGSQREEGGETTTLNESGSGSGNGSGWKTEDSGQLSKGSEGSFKAFI